MTQPSIQDEAIFLDQIKRYGGIIHRLCYYYSADEDDFFDLRQDVLATLWEARESYKGLSASSTWIYRVTLNVCISAFRKSTNRKRNSQNLDDVPDLAIAEDFKAERLSTMHSLIQQLPQQERAIILLWLDDLKYEEIAEITGLPRNTLATRLRRIKEKLCRMAKDKE